MSRPDPVALERLRYSQGQQLRSRDRRDQVAIEAQLRAWHNRSMHNVFGVAEGLDVEFGTESVVVSRGLAYDARGRELILQRALVVSYPTNPSTAETAFLLVVRYKESSQFPNRDEFDGLCFGRENGQLLDSPVISWQMEKGWLPEHGVPIARVFVSSSGVKPDAEDFVKRHARAIARARISTGETLPGHTSWELWSVPFAGSRVLPLGFQVRIETGQAGFTQVPCYFAWLRRTTQLAFDDLIVAPFEHIVESPTVTSFTFRIWLPQLLGPGPVLGKKHMNMNFQTRNDLKQSMYVSWIGIQEEPGLFSTHVHGGKTL